MCPDLPRERKFYLRLVAFDQHLVQECREGRCPKCGGRLDSRNYARKFRGGPAGLGDEFGTRFSLCCAVEDCRKSVTPFSVRFLGRKVYLGVVVVLMTALAQGVTRKRAGMLREEIGVSTRTVERWREWWLSTFRESRFWKDAGARFSPPVDEGQLPSCLLSRFAGEARDALVSLLRFLAPITTASAPGCQPV